MHDIVICTALVRNGRGEKIVPIYSTTFDVPLELYNDEALHRRAFEMKRDVCIHSHESSELHHFTVKSYGFEAFYVATPNIGHTRNIAEAILRGFGIGYMAKTNQ